MILGGPVRFTRDFVDPVKFTRDFVDPVKFTPRLCRPCEIYTRLFFVFGKYTPFITDVVHKCAFNQ